MAASGMTKLLLNFLLIQLTLGQERPEIGFISPDVVADIGGTVELVCTVRNGHEYPILWMRLESKQNANTLPISTGPNLFVRDTRFNLDFDPDAGSYKLIIKEVVKSDEGRYQCQVVTHVSNIITADVDVKVKVPPVLSKNIQAHVSAEVNKDAELSCEAEGFPNPKITWKRKDGTLLPNGKESITGNKLVITKVQKQHRGNYVCTADNGVGTPESKVITLQVGFPPSIEMPTPRVPQALHYEANLVCDIKAYPAPTIQWLKNETNIHNGGNFKISHFASQEEIVSSTLKIYSVTENDYGKYSCRAGNRYGSGIEHMELYKSAIPICPPICGDTNLNSSAHLATLWPHSILLLTIILHMLPL